MLADAELQLRLGSGKGLWVRLLPKKQLLHALLQQHLLLLEKFLLLMLVLLLHLFQLVWCDALYLHDL